MSNKHKALMVPKLRFPDFREVEGWKEVPLSELISALDAGVSVNSGDRPATVNEIGILKTSAVTNGIFEPQENKVVFDEVERGRVKEPVRGGTIIISRMNTPALVGANAYVEASLENLYLPDRLWAAKSKLGTSMRFVASILGSDKGRAALSELAKGSSGSMKNITKPDVLAFLIEAPSPAEQQKIADCLSSLDELIAAQARKVDALKTHKKGLMQQLFPREDETLPRLRFPEFWGTGEWQETRLGQLGHLVSGLTYSPDDVRENGLLVLRSSNIKNSKISLDDCVYVDPRTKGANLSIANDILICVRNGSAALIGKNALIPENMPLCTHGAFMTVFRTKSPKFVFQLMQTDKYKKQVAGDLGATINSINGSQLVKYTFMVPNANEQIKIAELLSFVDDLVAAQARELEEIKAHKRGLMQQLFPSQQNT